MSEREIYRGHLDRNRVEERRQMRRERKIAKSGLVVRWLLERLGKIILKKRTFYFIARPTLVGLVSLNVFFKYCKELRLKAL